MVEVKVENLMDLAREIAAERAELFGCEDHVALAMDRIIPGSAYLETDSGDEKLEKLYQRAMIYLKYDAIVSKEGQSGNLQIDSARKRLEIFNAHKNKFTDLEKKREFLLFMCQTNGLFLGREVLNKTFTFWTHQPIFDFFVQKNPYQIIPLLDEEHKTRLLLMPRGSFKSTADSVDCLQWIIGFPNIRIIFLTVSLDLAKSLVSEVKGYFTTNEKMPFTPFQLIIGPEFFLVENKEGKEDEFICPARTVDEQRKKEPTLWAGSLGSKKHGMHCEVLKADDSIDDANTETPALIAKSNKRIGMALNLLDPGCYNDNIGTPQAPNDWYNHVEQNVDDVLVTKRPAKWPRKDIHGLTALDRGKQRKDLADNEWTLLFPEDKNGLEKLSHKMLRKIQQRDPEGFASQYMLDCSGYKKVSFPQDLIETRTIDRDKLPVGWNSYPKYITWDLADTVSKTSDYSVGSVFAVSSEGTGFVVDMYRDRYTIGEICYTIAKAHVEHKPQRTIIEDARGASKLEGEIRRMMLDMGVKNPIIDFVKVSNVKAAKAIRIGKLEPKLRSARLWFVNSIGCYDDLLQEFVNYGSALHDDILDSLGYCDQFLDDARPGPVDPHAAAQAQRIMNAKAYDEMIYGDPEASYVDVPLDPLPGTEEGGTGNDSAGDLWNPFGPNPPKR